MSLFDKTKFTQEGYQVFPQVFHESETAQAQKEAQRMCTLYKTDHELWKSNITPLSALKEHRNPGVNASVLDHEPFIIGELPTSSALFTECILKDTLWDIATLLLNTEDVVYHFSNITRKPARIGPTIIWHRDFPNEYICPTSSQDCLRLLIPLEGMDSTNGTTSIIPQSHLITDALAIREQDKLPDVNRKQIVALALNPGDSVAIHSKLLHGGGSNRSNKDRNLMVIQFGAGMSAYIYHNREMFTGLRREEIRQQLFRLDASQSPSK